MVSIVTDSLCDVPEELNADGFIKIIPLTVTIGDKSYLDGRDFTHEEFFELLRRTGAFPKTSHPSVEAFMDIFKKEFDAGNSVVCICASPHISGTLGAAQSAAEAVAKDGRVDVVDSRTLSMGEGLLVLMAAEMARNGRLHDEIVEAVRTHAKNSKGLVALDTVEYLHKGGRLSTSKALIAEKLHIRPIIQVEPGGRLIMAGRALGMKKALRWVAEAVGRFRTDFTNTTVAIGYTVRREIAEELCKRLTELYKMGTVILYKAGSVIGSHTGPGTGAVFFEV